MDDRIQRALDGELSRGELTAAEAAEVEETRALLAGIVRAIPSPALPSLGAAVVARIGARESSRAAPDRAAAGHAASGRGVLGGFFGWLWSPARVSLTLRPAYGLAAAALVIFAAGVGLGSRMRSDARAGATSGAAVASTASNAAAQQRPVLVQFRFAAPGARTVSLAGDFSNWKPEYSLTRSGAGVWTIVVPLQPGVHDYSFVVDGDKWTPDPSAPPTADGFGGTNSRIAVIGSDATSAL